MIIRFDKLDPFLSELSKEATAGNVWRKLIYFDVRSTPEQGAEPPSFHVALILTALIDVPGHGQFIHEAGIVCGTDDSYEKVKDAGTKSALAMMEKVSATAHKLGLEVREGKLEA